MEELEKEKNNLLNSSIGNVAFCKKLITETYSKVVRKIKNLDSINPFVYKKEQLIKPEDVIVADEESFENFKNTHFAILPNDEVSFYKSKYIVNEKEKTQLTNESKITSNEKDFKSIASKNKQERNGINQSIHDAALKKLDIDEAAWYLDEISKIRNELWEKLKTRLEELAKIKEYLESIDETGVFWDLCQTDAFSADIETLLRWTRYLETNEEVKKLLELLGRALRQKTIRKKQLTQVEYTIPLVVPSITSKEEIKSVELGNDLLRVVPQEMIYLDNNELELLFYKKYAEKTLLCYHLEGQDIENTTNLKQEEIEIEEKEQKGPIIICIDTSGSMSGIPENVAKASALTLASQAIKENRECHIINFSTKIDTFTIDKNIGMEKLLEFLSMSFWGGTDVTPALDNALEQLEKEGFEKSDILIVSDFVMGNISEETLEKITLQKERETKFYGLNIGTDSYKPDFLDKQWIFNPSNNCILELSDVIV